jgi:hypothetical protein
MIPTMGEKMNHEHELTEMFRETIRWHGEKKRGLSQKLARKALYYFEKQILSRETDDRMRGST